MKKYSFLLIIAAQLILVILALLLAMNFETNVNVNLVNTHFSSILSLPVLSKNINLSVFILVVFLLGEIAAFFTCTTVFLNLKEKNNAYNRQLEKTSIEGSANASRVQVLENKIAVLEKALNDALKNS